MTKFECMLLAEDINHNVYALLATISKLVEDNERLKAEVIKLMDKDKGWISVEDALPEDDTTVTWALLRTDDGEYFTGFWREDAKWWDHSHLGWIPEDVNITHWKPLEGKMFDEQG